MARYSIFTNRRIFCFLLCLLLVLHGGMLAWSGEKHSPVSSEVLHLPAGLSHIYLGRFDLFRVNPPLVRSVAALPVAFMSPRTDWNRYSTSPLDRPDQLLSNDLFQANGEGTLSFFIVARWACIPFCLLGAFICFRWARELYGTAAGFMAMILWCFCPYILGHGSLITPDAHAAAMGVTAYYMFWRWLKHKNSALFVGIVLGLAELTKFTLLIFYPLWIVAWLLYRWIGRKADRADLPTDETISDANSVDASIPSSIDHIPQTSEGNAGLAAQTGHGPRTRRPLLSEGAGLIGIMLISVLVINIFYGFEGTFKSLGEFRFRSYLLKGNGPEQTKYSVGNRFSGTLLGKLPVPIPANMLQGLDTQKNDFDRGLWSYYRGEWSKHGWWHFYLYALAIKLPLGTLCLIALSVPCCFLSRYRSSWRDEMVLLLPIVAILALLSSQTGFSVHSRYAIPVLPFAYIWCSKVARSVEAGHKVLAFIAAIALCWSVGGSLSVYPHSLSYFNELVGGPMGGHRHLLDSNIAWGQDLYFLKQWYDEHPEARPLHLAYYNLFDPRLSGIEFAVPPAGPISANNHAAATLDSDIPPGELGPLPGWYAIDANHLQGSKYRTANGRGGWAKVSWDGYNLTYFQRFQPVAMAGYSIYIYHITPEEANRVRRELGLPELKADDGKRKAEE